MSLHWFHHSNIMLYIPASESLISFIMIYEVLDGLYKYTLYIPDEATQQGRMEDCANLGSIHS